MLITEVIEYFAPCKRYKEHLRDGSITDNMTLRDILNQEDIWDSDKEWFCEHLLDTSYTVVSFQHGSIANWNQLGRCNYYDIETFLCLMDHALDAFEQTYKKGESA